MARAARTASQVPADAEDAQGALVEAEESAVPALVEPDFEAHVARTYGGYTVTTAPVEG